jgi:hypothetical protein
MDIRDNISEWRNWQYAQEKHRQRIKKIYASTSSRIDNHSTSLFPKATQMKSANNGIYGSSLNLREIERKNQKILEKLTQMAKSPVILKTLPLAKNKVNTRKYFLKKLENGRLHQENIMFAKRLAKTSSSVNFRKMEEEFENNQKYSKIRQKFK